MTLTRIDSESVVDPDHVAAVVRALVPHPSPHIRNRHMTVIHLTTGGSVETHKKVDEVIEILGLKVQA